jgi:hypothetical protein
MNATLRRAAEFRCSTRGANLGELELRAVQDAVRIDSHAGVVIAGTRSVRNACGGGDGRLAELLSGGNRPRTASRRMRNVFRDGLVPRLERRHGAPALRDAGMMPRRKAPA